MAFIPPNWLEISQKAFKNNIFQLKRLIGGRTLAIVIKANAYGHGIEQIATLAEKSPLVDWLCVATLSEALQVRSIGATKPVLITSCIDADPAQAVQKNIAFTIYNLETVQELDAIGKKYNYTFPIHIKIDTGLSRLGITPQDAHYFIQTIQTYKYVTIQGIYSHFAESQNKDTAYTQHQIDQFQSLITSLDITIPHVHIANSAATLRFDFPFCTMFRVGISTYGIWPNHEMKTLVQQRYSDFKLIPILEWKAKIIALKTVPAHQSVGYNREYTPTKQTVLAILPIGYYDGYDFRLYNKSYVLINGHYAPVVGRISMNMMTIDITSIKNVSLGTEVTIMGNYPNLRADKLGVLAGNPNAREITTKLNPAIKRIIV